MPLVNWRDIADNYSDTLILGNGASCAISPGFSYTSLLNVAKKHNYLNKPAIKLFTLIKNDDFEMAMRLIDTSSFVFDALNSRNRTKTKLQKMRKSVRSSLIKAVRLTHETAYEDLTQKSEALIEFCQQFKTIFSLNYDLLLYWMMMSAKNFDGCISPFKDCFLHGLFKEDFDSLRDPIRPCQNSTLVFYPHGHLALTIDSNGIESKISANGNQLINAIADAWARAGVRPLFISEGDTASKLRAINRSHYLRCTLKELKADKNSIVVYGWSASQQDDHLLDAIFSSRVQRIAFSIRQGDNEDQTRHKVLQLTNRITEFYTERNKQPPYLDFFAASSPGCWCYPEQQP